MQLDPENYILIVDDVAFMRRILKGILTQLGYGVAEAESGADAIAHIKRVPPRLVILDMMMPDMSGIEVCKWIRSHAPTTKVPVIMCTAKNDRKFLEEAIRGGISDCILKPVDRKMLSERLEKYLGKAPAAQEADGEDDLA